MALRFGASSPGRPARCHDVVDRFENSASVYPLSAAVARVYLTAQFGDIVVTKTRPGLGVAPLGRPARPLPGTLTLRAGPPGRRLLACCAHPDLETTETRSTRRGSTGRSRSGTPPCTSLAESYQLPPRRPWPAPSCIGHMGRMHGHVHRSRIPSWHHFHTFPSISHRPHGFRRRVFTGRVPLSYEGPASQDQPLLSRPLARSKSTPLLPPYQAIASKTEGYSYPNV